MRTTKPKMIPVTALTTTSSVPPTDDESGDVLLFAKNAFQLQPFVVQH